MKKSKCGNQINVGPLRNNGTERKFSKQMLLDFSLSTTLNSHYDASFF